MSNLIVVDDLADWAMPLPGVEVMAARTYLTDPAQNAQRGARVFNLCRSYEYQGLGYYVSLLAEARRHRPHPDVTSIQDLKMRGTVRILTEDLTELAQKNLRTIQSDTFELSVYFGRNMATRYARLARRFFDLFGAPLMRAYFARDKEVWTLKSVRAISMDDVPARHHEFMFKAAESYFARPHRPAKAQTRYKYGLAILYDPEEPDPPWDEQALKRFARAGEKLGFGVDLITRDDLTRLATFDALFIRATTSVNHYTYRFARRAEAEGLVVMDDSLSISRCTNKVFLAHRLTNHGIGCPQTVIVHKGNLDEVIEQLGLPCVLKQPDSAFSIGVCKIESREELQREIRRMLDKSELLIAQEFTPTDFDWRVGVLDHQPLFVCKYHMAKAHWQIIDNSKAGGAKYGKVETMPVEDAPRQVMRTALKAADLMGDGLYGVDLKQSGRRVMVMEVNDNPNINAGYEDKILKDGLYERIMSVFYQRVVNLKR